MKRIIIVLMVGFALVGAANAATVILYPNAAGDVTQIASYSPNANHWANVNAHDAYGSYNYNYVNGPQYDLYNLQDPAVTGTINSVTVSVECYDYYYPTYTTYSTIKVKTGGVEYNSTEMTNTLRDWNAKSYTWATNPGGGAWTWSAINGLQAGVSLRSTNGSSQPNAVTCVMVVVDYTPGGGAVSNDAIFFGGD
jgi:hypothetical protein